MSESENVVAAEIVRKHRWPPDSERRIHGSEYPDGNDRTEKTCPHCGLVKITVHPAGGGIPWREWRHKNGSAIALEHTPPCVEDGAAA